MGFFFFFLDLVGGIKEQGCKKNVGLELGGGRETARKGDGEKGGRGRIRHTQRSANEQSFDFGDFETYIAAAPAKLLVIHTSFSLLYFSFFLVLACGLKLPHFLSPRQAISLFYTFTFFPPRPTFCDERKKRKRKKKRRKIIPEGGRREIGEKKKIILIFRKHSRQFPPANCSPLTEFMPGSGKVVEQEEQVGMKALIVFILATRVWYVQYTVVRGPRRGGWGVLPWQHIDINAAIKVEVPRFNGVSVEKFAAVAC